MLPLRFCYIKFPCLFNEECRRSPNLANKDFTDTMLSGFNVSLLAKDPSLQSPTNESKAIDACLLSIQKNESDAVFAPYAIPVIMSNIITGPVFLSDKIVIFSTYKVENDTSNAGILDTFDAFGVDAIALILNFFLTLAALILFTYILERKSPRRLVRMNGRRFNLRFVPWFIFRFFVKQFPLFPGNMTALKVLLTCCLLTFSYFVTFFYSSMIKTDMVTVKAPKVIVSYQDILDGPEIKPYIYNAFDEYTSFKHAEQGSLKRKIWERILKMGVNELVNHGRNLELLDPKSAFMNSKAVMLGYASLLDAGKHWLPLIFKKENIRGLYVSDPTESEKLSASVINRMTTEAVSHKYQAKMRRLFEGHFYYKYMKTLGLEQAQFYANFFEMGKDTSDFEQYFSPRVVLPSPELVKPNITYFMSLFISYLILCIIQFIVFLIERWVSDRD